jgi:hypothetical protein
MKVERTISVCVAGLLLVCAPILAQRSSAQQQVAQSQPTSQQTQPSPGAAASNSNAGNKDSSSGKVYTNRDVKALPPGAVSLVGPATPAPSSASNAPARSASTNAADQTAKTAAYWKARFTAARNKLDHDQKALPVLKSQLEDERVQQESVDEDTGQVNSDWFVDLSHQIDAAKLAIQKDKKALSGLHEEFRRAGGLPGWIR